MDTDRLYDQVYAQASQARNLSKIAYDEALTIYSEAQSITLPTISAQDLSDEAARISEEVRGRDGDAKVGSILTSYTNIQNHYNKPHNFTSGMPKAKSTVRSLNMKNNTNYGSFVCKVISESLNYFVLNTKV